jgi:hypothetical protein
MIKWYQSSMYPHDVVLRMLARAVAFAGITAIVVFVAQHALGIIHWSTLGANLLIGAMMSGALWGTERLVNGMMNKMMIEPSSLRGFVLRLPFLYVASGIGYTGGMVTAKKIGLIGFYDIPIRPVFTFGAGMGIVLLLALYLLSYYLTMKRFRSSSQ